MKSVYGLFAVACLSIAACASEAPSTDVSGDDSQSPPATQLIHYDSHDVAALPLGEFLHFDLTDPNAVYSFEYSNPAELDHVMIHTGSEDYILGERTAAADKAADGVKREAVLSASGLDTPNVAAPVACNCPCCQLVNGVLVCCR